MNRKQQIEKLQNDKKELENKLSGFELSDSDMIVINNKVRQIDSTLDEILDINIIIDKRESQSDITFDQVMLSRFVKMKGVENKDDEETYQWWLNRY